MSPGDAAGASPGARMPSVVVLAAGQGTRMRSSLPKVLHEVAGRPMLEHVLRAARATGPRRVVVVVGHGAERVRERFAGQDDLRFVEQSEQLGTGHALQCALPALDGQRGPVLVLYGDQPLTDPETLRSLLGEQRRLGGAVLLSYQVEDPTGLGRVLRAPDGALLGIVEERDADASQRDIKEVYPGVFVFDDRVEELLRGLTRENRAGEYYLTQMVDLYRRAGRPVHAHRGSDAMRFLVGVNTRSELARAEELLRAGVREAWMAAGVTMHRPAGTAIDDEVRLARDVVLEAGVLLRGGTRVGEGARIGAYAVLEDCRVDAGARVPPHTVARGQHFVAT